ncbi:MAG TPA: hypothetical protein VFA18_08335, partial [Gemmataceae bacterium]|nr:hypothetical protein [Gemmataceae bacterium]
MASEHRVQPDDGPAEQHLPSEFRSLSEWLVAQGFTREDSTRGGVRWLNRIDTYTRDACIIRFVLDNGEWTLQIYGTGFANPGYGAGWWQAYLVPGETPLRREMTFGEQAAIVRALLPQIEAAIATDPEVETRLWRTYLLRRPRPQSQSLVAAWQRDKDTAMQASLPQGWTNFRPPAEV